ncbi:MAG: ATP-dependent zinc metalloprotease FtsH [Luteolibacter sp.]|uniref:ATP-dependent zinc metalloprotease FtsH n=1 Tax=Luteolibacter sp. TaxID=1962973 RepID=UPI003263EF0F
MSDSPNSTPPSNNPNRGAGDANGFNWRLLGLMCLATVILGVAYFNPITNKTVKEMNYSQFRQAWDQGRILVDNTKQPLEVITTDTSFDATITGWITPEPVAPKTDTPKKDFRVLVNFALQGKEINELLGTNIRFQQVNGSTEKPLENDAIDTLSLADLRKALALNLVEIDDSGNSLRVLTTAGSDDAVIVGTRKIVDAAPQKLNAEGKVADAVPFSVAVSTAIQSDDLNKLVKDKAVYKRNKDYLSGMLTMFLPLLLIMGVLFFLFRQQMKSAGRGAMSFGKSKARLLTMDRNKVTFKDVAGIQEAKEELFEIVDFLRDPRKFQKLGGSIPKGVLMVGSPGTGKTLLARAIAGEADVPFFSISGSDFVEMFVGVGASRVRDMFEQGRKHAPCLIFIDEIDAVGRHRGHGMGGGHDEREQTLNQLLVEMDGFDTQEGVIIIAATNRPDVLDPALLRPGRFDRQVTISLPDVNGREEILRVHVKKIKLAAGVDLSKIAKGTPGFSGAELANLINEAALLAARRGLSAVTLDEMEEARDKVRWGRERRSLAMSDKEKTGTAWHEAGHAYLNMVLPDTNPLHKVTIIPRGPYLGATMYLPDGDKYSTQKKEALANLIVTMGGRIAEGFHSDDVSNGASGDIRQATSLARHMVCEWGMSDKLGMVEYGEGDGPVFLGRGDMGGRRTNYSESTAQTIDEEIKRFIDEAYEIATRILNEGRDKVELIAKALLEFETLDATHLKDIIDFGEMRNPPTAPKPPPIPDELKKKPVAKATEEDRPEGPGPIPGAVGAPA